MNHSRPRNFLLFFCFVVFAGAFLHAQTPVKVRKSIYDLTPTELANYTDAIRQLKANNTGGPTPPSNSYEYWAMVHNNMGGYPAGGCIHGQVTFLIWHRAFFYHFEQELQKMYPNLTIPYYDFTVPPPASDGGKKFPKAYEDSTSVLYPSLPMYNGFARRSVSTVPVPPLFTPEQLTACVNIANWTTFRQTLEGTYHNQMHNLFLGNPIQNPGTAAEDPLFWSFHAYIDLLFDKWQKINNYPSMGNPNQTIFLTCQQCSAWPYSKDIVKNFVNIEDQLFYTYNNTTTSQVVAMTSEAATQKNVLKMTAFSKKAFALPSANQFKPAQKPVKAVYVYPVKLPEKGFWDADLTITGITALSTHPVGVTVYLHPRNKINTGTLKDDGPIAAFSVLQGHGMMNHGNHDDHAMTADHTIDITQQLLAAHARGVEMAVTVIFEAIPRFSKDALPPGSDIKFGAVNITFDSKK